MRGRESERQQEEARWSGWMSRAQNGDRDAYDRLLRSILPRLRAFVGARVRDRTLAEDVVQNVLISIHQARHTYRPERPFGPWLRAVARNAVIDALRARLEPVAPGEPIESRDALSPALAAALAELPPTQREAVELLHIHDLSSAEAAERLGISAVALRVRAHRGYKALRAKLRREDI